MTQPPTPTPTERGGDPAMDDILASIRQILTEEDNARPSEDKPKDVLLLDPSMMVPAPAPGQATEPGANDVLTLDSTMMVPAASPAPKPPSDEAVPPMPPPAAIPVPAPKPQQNKVVPLEPSTKLAPPPAPQPPPPQPKPDVQAMTEPESPPPASAPHSAGGPTETSRSLVAPQAAAAAASSLGELVRKLSGERTVPVHRGGPTIEDMVREELRPLLKEWLDTHLPAVVERLVRVEIERVVGQTTL